MMPPLIERHFERLKSLYAEARLEAIPGNQNALVVMPQFQLPDGWNKQLITVRFVVPFTYPGAPPDCFWTDPDLRLRDGRAPQATGQQPIPGVSIPLLWFSWHVQQWDPNRHTISSYVQIIRDRFNKVQ